MFISYRISMPSYLQIPKGNVRDQFEAPGVVVSVEAVFGEGQLVVRLDESLRQLDEEQNVGHGYGRREQGSRAEVGHHGQECPGGADQGQREGRRAEELQQRTRETESQPEPHLD